MDKALIDHISKAMVEVIEEYKHCRDSDTFKMEVLNKLYNDESYQVSSISWAVLLGINLRSAVLDPDGWRNAELISNEVSCYDIEVSLKQFIRMFLQSTIMGSYTSLKGYMQVMLELEERNANSSAKNFSFKTSHITV